MQDGTEPVSDGELLYRRISVPSDWYSPETGLKAEAFAPHKTGDVTGLSVNVPNTKLLNRPRKAVSKVKPPSAACPIGPRAMLLY